MAQSRDQYGNQMRQTTDGYGNLMGRGVGGGTAAYGAGTGGYDAAAGAGYGSGGYGASTGGYGPGGSYGAGYHEGVAGGGKLQPVREQQQGRGFSGTLQRSGSSGSRSSEDDGMGGRRKKGLKEKIKEKLPGHKSEEQHQQAGFAHQGAAPHDHEKKGVMEKIKEKLPGHKPEEQHQHQQAAGYAYQGGATPYQHEQAGYAGYQGGAAAHEPEKKGMMEKIKEKLPGHH